MFLRRILFFIFLMIGCSIVSFAQTGKPIATVRSFYAFDRSHSQIFTRSSINARHRWFSPALYKLFMYELRREDAYLRRHPHDKPYFGDGLPFQPYDETCKSGKRIFHKEISFKPDAEDAGVATVRVTFDFPAPCTEKDPTTYTIELVNGNTGWLIDNVVYEGDSNLVKDLSRKDY